MTDPHVVLVWDVMTPVLWCSHRSCDFARPVDGFTPEAILDLANAHRESPTHRKATT